MEKLLTGKRSDQQERVALREGVREGGSEGEGVRE